MVFMASSVVRSRRQVEHRPLASEDVPAGPGAETLKISAGEWTNDDGRWADGLGYRDGMTQPTQISEITADEANQMVESGAYLLDVREDDEWEAGHAPAAVHLPMGLVSERLAEIPTDRVIVCVCRMGGRSGSVATALEEAGYDVHNLNGGMTAWEIAGLPVVTDESAPGQIV
jgi:rhodanese-related sulfurtransferase